jgi:hypothetical protein
MKNNIPFNYALFAETFRNAVKVLKNFENPQDAINFIETATYEAQTFIKETKDLANERN